MQIRKTYKMPMEYALLRSVWVGRHLQPTTIRSNAIIIWVGGLVYDNDTTTWNAEMEILFIFEQNARKIDGINTMQRFK